MSNSKKYEGTSQNKKHERPTKAIKYRADSGYQKFITPCNLSFRWTVAKLAMPYIS